MAFDGIVTKAIASELQNLVGAKVDKIFQPDKNTVLLGLYFKNSHYLLNICTDARNYRMHLTTHPKPNPKIAPNFCMVLRKHLLGLSIKNMITNDLERLVMIEFEGFDDVDDILSKRLIIELMGKHCNIILLDDQNRIIDSLRHIHKEENDTRDIVPHIQYVYPTTTKYNFLNCLSFEEWNEKVSSPSSIYDVFNGISQSFVEASLKHLKIEIFDQNTSETFFHYLKNMISKTDGNDLTFQLIDHPKKDYFLVERKENISPFSLNFFLDDFYHRKETSEEFKSYRNYVLKMILEVLKKYQKRLVHIDEKLEDSKDREKYKLYGELITANLYQIRNENISEITLDNYYTGQKITIPLDGKYSPSVNAKRFFKKYHKLKNAFEIVQLQKEETLQELSYIESIIYELENCSTIEEVSEIWEEISENVMLKEKTEPYQKRKKAKVKKSTLTKNKNVSFNPLKYTIDGYSLFVGRNNKENDYLTLKYAKKEDLWFHTKEIHGSHAILKLAQNQIPDPKVLIQCAQIVAYHSKARNSSNVPVDFCEVRFVKKPNGAKPGMVIYHHNQTLYVTPKRPF